MRPSGSTAKNVILLTGATGMVGSQVMAKLLASGASVAVIARDVYQRRHNSPEKQIITAQTRIDHLLNRFETHLGTKLPRPTLIRGDLNSDSLGIDARDRQWIEANVASVIHSAASLSFKPASESSTGEPYRTNVTGTANLIKTCRDAGIDDFHYVSTAYVCGLRSGHVREQENDCGQSFSNDYERSKCQAEQLVRSNSGFPSATIYRPSIVIDSTGLSPVSEDRTVYGAYSLFQTLSSKVGLPTPGEWFRNLGFTGNERKNLVEADWVAEAICRIFLNRALHGKTYHLTDRNGTSIDELERAFFEVASELNQHDTANNKSVGSNHSPNARRSTATKNSLTSTNERSKREMIDAIAAPFVETFKPYFRDDPYFDRQNIDHAIHSLDFLEHPPIQHTTIAAMIRYRREVEGLNHSQPSIPSPIKTAAPRPTVTKTAAMQEDDGQLSDDPIVVIGRAVRLPDGIDSIQQFEQLLFEGLSALTPVPESRFDRELYFDQRRGEVGKSYTQFGGCVSPQPLDATLEAKIGELGQYDLTHRQFAQVVVKAWEDSELPLPTTSTTAFNHFASRCGIFVGHSGGTDQGGPLAMATLADAAVNTIENVKAIDDLPLSTRQRVRDRTAQRLRSGRPIRSDASIHFDAYSAASLVSRLLSLGGIREVIDAACASSLLALSHAISAIRNNRIDSAIIGGATYNNVDNLILFSQSQACSESNSSPFDKNASGLISSEGYVAITITRLSIAEKLGLPIRAVIRNVGVSSDGRGKSLWAPRTEGQQLAIRRGYPDQQPLTIDYLEAHATSTQVGDATELVSLVNVAENRRDLLVGSVKSNLGHTLEAAGLVGLVKLLISIDREAIPPTINFKDPTPEFDWKSNQIRVVDKVTAWPSDKERNAATGLRRCAVNAFGIGGLNGHAVIESFTVDSIPKSRSASAVSNRVSAPEPIAIVGRGVVLPGSFTIDAFGALLSSDKTAIIDPPTGRWLGGTDLGLTPFKVPTRRGGYIDGYRFDGQPYRIPPKQVNLANPLQMMLIDAVEQAAGEADGGKWIGDRQKTSVIIGTIFGGEFSNHLQIGLRLPEICRTLSEELIAEGISLSKAQLITSQYYDLMLRRHSAILDETGGFTASTLASRIAKTFDLMGGACAVDADDASGGLALLLAADQLRSNSIDTVICGVARRSLDLVGYKDLQVQNRLASDKSADQIAIDCSSVLPGEGVAVVMLRRLSDAVKDGQKILGIIDLVDAGASADANALWHQAMATDPINQRIVSKIGYLAGAHPLVRIIAETLRWQTGNSDPKLVTSVAKDGFHITAAVRAPAKEPMPDVPPSIEQQHQVRKNRIDTVESNGHSAGKNGSFHSVNSSNSIDMPKRTIVIQGADEADFAQQLHQAMNSPVDAFASGDLSGVSTSVPKRKRFIAGVIADTPQTLATGLQAIAKAWDRGHRSCVLDRNLAVLWDSQLGHGRVAWAFPGQGAQYSAVPQVVSQDDQVADYLKHFDQTLIRMGLNPIADNLADRESLLGHDVWWTQLWVLAVSCTLSDSLSRAGLRADLVFGHSFGECGAALHAGVMSTEQAIRFAKMRSEAVVMTTQSRGQLLSIRATPSRVEAILAKLDLPLHLTHHNSPLQTVIAGNTSQIDAAKAAFTAESIASVIIPVPAAYHSPAMASARIMLKNGFNNQRLRPPRIGYFSTIRRRYLAEPDSIRKCLVDQLTSPLLYCGAVERLVADGYRLLVDVGPSDMLTKLHRDIVGNSALCVSLDSNHHTHCDRLRLIALAESFITQSALPTTLTANTLAPAASTPANNTIEEQKPAALVDIIDVTRRGRSKNTSDKPSQNGVVHSLDQAMISLHDIAPRHSAEKIDDQTAGETVALEQPVEAIDLDLVNRFLVDLVVELTGYHPDLIDFDADLEAELGVDSIKKAQVIGELAEWASLELDLKRMRLADFQSLADIAKLASSHRQNTSATITRDIHSVQVAGHRQSAKEAAAVSSHPSHASLNGSSDILVDEPQESDNGDAVTSLMIDFIVDQTGYSPDIIDLEADLEAELGVDSIKKAQLLGELATHFELQNVDLRKLRLADFPTLGSIRDFVYKHDSKNIAILARGRSHEAGEGLTGAKKKMTDLAEASVTPQPEFDALPVKHPSTFDRPIPGSGTCRFGLALAQSPRRGGMPMVPHLTTGALILGHNRIAAALSDKLHSLGVAVQCIPASATVETIDSILNAIWNKHETPHLFITTPHDNTALDELNTAAWTARRDMALSIPFRTCQLWMQRMIDQSWMDRATLVSVVNAGGDFGFSSSNVVTPESGGLAGLTKAMLIEAWMRGYRQTPMKVIDIAPKTSSAAAIEGIFAELAVPSHDEEVSVDGNNRLAVRPCYSPLTESVSEPASPPTRGGTWIITGGGRGITAMTSIALAERYDLKLHLLGTAPLPNLSENVRQQAATQRAALRRDVMSRAQAAGENPIEAWRDLEKAIEIDLTLQQCQAKGLDATYHCVDVSDSLSVSKLLDEIRNLDGPIKGVIHGAGAGQDARFDRKRLEKVEKCIRAKVDGAIALAEATMDDPLEWFVGFGSISGRFGANGHTDYSLANDMLAKVVGRLRQQRPDVRCVTFHWHAWGDIGMATKPEAKLALEMIGMEFMPASEGLQHFLSEFEHGGNMPEVLITDRNYIRKFFPGFGEANQSTVTLPILSPSGNAKSQATKSSDQTWAVTLDPHRDRFLSEHLVGGKPTLPFVIALEMMAEAAKHASGGMPVRLIRNAQAFHALKFTTDDAMAIEIVARNVAETDKQEASDQHLSSWSICADLRRRDGRIVESSREHFHASVISSENLTMPEPIRLNDFNIEEAVNSDLNSDARFSAIEYLDRDAAVFHGEPLRTLHRIAFVGASEAIGLLTAPSPVQLGGERRPVDGWCIPCAVMDGMLYASAMLAYHISHKPSLPVRFGSIHLGRLPDPGEPLRVAIRVVSRDENGMTMDADLIGLNDDPLISIRNYRIHWIG